MASKLEQILAALDTALTSGVSGATVYRSRVLAFSKGKLPAVVIEPIQEVADYPLLSQTDFISDIKISIHNRGNIPDQACDPFKEDVHETIMDDVSLGGLSMDIRLNSINYELLDTDDPTCIVTMVYRIFYRTGFESLSP